MEGLSVKPNIQEFVWPPFIAHRAFAKTPVDVDIFGVTVSFEYAPAAPVTPAIFFIA